MWLPPDGRGPTGAARPRGRDASEAGRFGAWLSGAARPRTLRSLWTPKSDQKALGRPQTPSFNLIGFYRG